MKNINICYFIKIKKKNNCRDLLKLFAITFIIILYRNCKFLIYIIYTDKFKVICTTNLFTPFCRTCLLVLTYKLITALI